MWRPGRRGSTAGRPRWRWPSAWVPPLAVLVALVGRPVPAAAHDVDVTSVARVFLDEVAPFEYRLSVVDLQAPALPTDGVVPGRCVVAPGAEPGIAGPAGSVNGLSFRCPDGLRFDETIVLPWTLAGVVVLARWSDGTEASSYFRGDGSVVSVELDALRAGSPSVGRLAASYTVLGAEHILLGIDHLLFVAGLLLLIQGGWALVRTVTAFTVAHSITLAAAVMGWVPVAAGPVEAAIALSIILLAREIVLGAGGSPGAGRRSLAQDSPWIVAFAFGLLHGFGFAGALGEIGLRAADVPIALLFFNLGVEAGQLVFVAAALAVGWAIARFAASHPGVAKGQWFVRPTLGYTLGAVATLWFLERLPAVFGVG